MAQDQIAGVSHGTAHGHEFTGKIPAESIRGALDRLLASHEFRSSKRCQDFLRYIVETTLSGNAELLKERTIGVDVFGRPASYDPGEDATVRVKAGEVRKRLGLYYAGEGANEQVRIELPGGTYVPDFHEARERAGTELAANGKPEPASAAIAATIQQPDRRTLGRLGTVMLAGGVILAFASLSFWTLGGRTDTVLDQFWSPVLKGAAPVSLCASFVPVYALDQPEPARPPRVGDFVLLPDQFVGGGDLMAVARIGMMLSGMHRPYQVRIGDGVSFDDLRAAPAILVGYSYSRWKDISSQMRFFIDINRRPLGVMDNGVLTKWTLPNLKTDRRTNEDYAIVSRVFHPDTRTMLVEVAGITQYGTRAAADLVTNPDLLAEALRNAPAGWQKRNLQLVVHVKVISGAPTTPKTVAAHFW